MATTVKRPERITIGAGIFRYMPYTTDPARRWNEMVDFGVIKDCKIKIERTVKTFEDGTPIEEVLARVLKETGVLECALYENFPEERIVKLGAGTVTDYEAESAKSETEIKTFTGTAFESLKGKGTLASVVVQAYPVTATPTIYDLTDDYVMGTKEGCAAIRRVEGGAIKGGQKIQITYTWNKPGGKRFVVGGTSAINEYLGEHVKELPDGGRLIHRFKFTSPGSSEDNFLSEDWGSSSVGLKLLADTTLSAGEQLYEEIVEDAA